MCSGSETAGVAVDWMRMCCCRLDDGKSFLYFFFFFQPIHGYFITQMCPKFHTQRPYLCTLAFFFIVQTMVP